MLSFLILFSDMVFLKYVYTLFREEKFPGQVWWWRRAVYVKRLKYEMKKKTLVYDVCVSRSTKYYIYSTL